MSITRFTSKKKSSALLALFPAIVLTALGNAYLTGYTHSSTFPTANAIQRSVSGAGSSIVYSTYLGGSGGDEGSGNAVEGAGNAYVSGATRSTNFPTANPIHASNAGSGRANVFVTKIADVPGLPLVTPMPDDGQIVISQIYGAGGVSGAAYRNSYIEIFNRGSTTANLNGIEFNLALGNGTFDRRFSGISSNNPIPIQPGQYFLIKMGSGGNFGSFLPEPDLDFSSSPFSSFTNAGKWAIAIPGTGSLVGTCPLPNSNILDLVGFGSTNCSEGSGAVSALGPSIAAFRRGSGCTDTDSNAADFQIAAPNPRNSGSPLNPCFVSPTPTPTPTMTPTVTPTPTPTPTPSTARISGRVLTPNGLGIRNAIVAMTDAQGVRRVSTTSSFGVFTFTDVAFGENYVIGVSNKRYRFASRTLTVTNDISDLDFFGLE